MRRGDRVEEDREEVATFEGVFEVDARTGTMASKRAGDGARFLRDPSGDACFIVGQDRGEQVVLVSEVQIEGAEADVGPLGDGSHAGLVQAAFGKESPCRLEQASARRQAAALGTRERRNGNRTSLLHRLSRTESQFSYELEYASARRSQAGTGHPGARGGPPLGG